MIDKKPYVNPKKCIGCSSCTFIAKGAFCMNENGLAVAKEDITSDNNQINEALESCPVKAISYIDDNSANEED